MQFKITPLDESLRTAVQAAINNKTKPLGALGELENLALQIALIQATPQPVLNNPHIVVFAADHGIAAEGVSLYPQVVTAQMVLNFLQSGAAINVFCRQHHIALSVVDAGVMADFSAHKGVIDQKIALGSANILHQPAMSLAQCEEAITKGASWIRQIHQISQCNVIGFGEMGIGNTAVSALLMHHFTHIPLLDCIGRGTGLDDEKLLHKQQILTQAYQKHEKTLQNATWVEVLATLGGFEIAQMCGAILEAAQQKMLILVDGFIASVAFLVAYQANHFVKDYAVFCHQSAEKGHTLLLNFLNVKPLLQLNLRLGEGTGCALAYPLIESAVNFLNEMATFESAKVSKA